MSNTDFNQKVESILSNTDLSIDERIDAVLTIKEELEYNGYTLNASEYVEVLKALINIIKEENCLATNIRDLLQLYTILAETYDEQYNYQPLEQLSFEIREILRDERIAWDIIDSTLPHIIEVLKNTVFHHETYRLLLVYLHYAFRNDALDKKLKGDISYLLKLRLLLEDGNWHTHWLNNMQTTIAELFTPEELIKLILNPTIGSLRVDPVEYTYRWEDIYYEMEKELDRRFVNIPRHMGFCFRYWSAKMELLKTKYDLDWRSPSQMNPRVMFD